MLTPSLRQQSALALCLHRVIQTRFLTNQRACDKAVKKTVNKVIWYNFTVDWFIKKAQIYDSQFNQSHCLYYYVTSSRLFSNIKTGLLTWLQIRGLFDFRKLLFKFLATNCEHKHLKKNKKFVLDFFEVTKTHKQPEESTKWVKRSG